MSNARRILIIGAGPTGLGAARQLERLGHHDWLLLEAQDYAGGLATSFEDKKGFTWDIGGHVQFSHYDYFDQAMDEFLGPDGWLSHVRESWIWIRDRFVAYPLQNNVHRLPAEDLHRCLEGLIDITRSPRASPGDFGEWIEANFGHGLAEVFLRPYNFKVWAYPPEAMNARWVGERVAVTDLSRVLKNLVFNLDDYSWGPNNTFRFPKAGGTGAIWKACAQRLPRGRLQFGVAATGIDLDARQVTASDGRLFDYDQLISTIPLTELISISGQKQLKGASERGLLHSSSNIVGIGLHGAPPAELEKKCWIYFPEDNCPFYRVTVFSNYSPANVPAGGPYWSLMCEVSESEAKPLPKGDLAEAVIQGLINTRLIKDRSEVASRWMHRASYGYPTPGLHRDEALGEIVPYFERYDVYSRGRFGLWKYEVSNQDHSFMQGVEIVERLINGRQELTAFAADWVNGSKHPWPFDRWSRSSAVAAS